MQIAQRLSASLLTMTATPAGAATVAKLPGAAVSPKVADSIHSAVAKVLEAANRTPGGVKVPVGIGVLEPIALWMPEAAKSPIGGGRILDPGVQSPKLDAMNRAARTNELLTNAGNVGLSPQEVQRLREVLDKSSDFATDSKLVGELLMTANSDRALRTFCELDYLRRERPDRITPDVVRTLTLGVGDSRMPGFAGEDLEGILGPDAAYRAAQTLMDMKPADYSRIMFAYNEAGIQNSGGDPQTEKALILKAVAARQDRLTPSGGMMAGLESAYYAGSEILKFAIEIHKMPKAELIRRTSVMDLDGDNADEALQQRFGNACTPATIQIMHAEADPVYAWQLQKDSVHGAATTGAIAEEQRAMLEANGQGVFTREQLRMIEQSENLFEMLTGMKVVPGSRGLSPEHPLAGQVSPLTGRDYRLNATGSKEARAAAADRMEALLKRGVDVPVTIEWLGGALHTMLITDVRGQGDGRGFVVTDPGNGRTFDVSRIDLINGSSPYFGTLKEYFA